MPYCEVKEQRIVAVRSLIFECVHAGNCSVVQPKELSAYFLSLCCSAQTAGSYLMRYMISKFGMELIT